MWTLDDDDVVFEVNRQARVPPEDQVNAVTKFFGWCSRWRARRGSGWGRSASTLGRLNIRRRVWFHIGDRQIQDRVVALLLDNPGWKFHATEISVVAIAGVKQHVAEHRIVQPGFDAFDHVLLVNVPIDLGFVLAHECHNVIFLAADRLRLDSGVIGRGRSQETIRRHPDFQLLRPRCVGVDNDRLVLRLFADDRLLAATTRRIFTLHANPVHTGSRSLKVDDAGVRLIDKLRPRRAWVRGLSYRKIHTRTGIFDRFQIVRTHCPGRVANDGFGILGCGYA